MTPEEIKKWYKQWCKTTKRSGGVLVGGSIQELLLAFSQHVAEDEVKSFEKAPNDHDFDDQNLAEYIAMKGKNKF